jgi:TetR/AcrR family transcriptional repressor of bet genes
MRLLLSDLRRDAVARLGLARSPEERVCAVIDACFGEEQFDERVFSAWLALYGNARQAEPLQRILTIYHRRLHSSLMHDLRLLVSGTEARRLAEGIAAMIDGLWLRYALTGSPGEPDTPRALTRDYFAAVLERTSGQRPSPL